MQRIEGVVNNSNGLTSHLSVELVSEANKFDCKIVIHVLDEEADLKSIMNVMALVVPHGEKFFITFEGDDDEVAKNKFEDFLTKNDLK